MLYFKERNARKQMKLRTSLALIFKRSNRLYAIYAVDKEGLPISKPLAFSINQMDMMYTQGDILSHMTYPNFLKLLYHNSSTLISHKDVGMYL